MKKFFTFCVLFLAVTLGVNAVTLTDDDRFYLAVSSYDAAGTAGGFVSLKIDKDFTAVVTLPKMGTVLYGDTVKIETVLQYIDELGVSGVETHKDTIASNTTGVQQYLEDVLSNTYEFTGTKEFTLKVGDLDEITFEISRSAGSYTYTIKPKTDADKTLAQSAWQELTSHITTSKFVEGDPLLCVTEGSFIQNDNEVFKMSGDYKFYGITALRSAMQEVKNVAELTILGYNTKKIAEALAPGSYLTIANTVLNMNETLYLSLDDADHDMYIPKFFTNVRTDVNNLLAMEDDTKMKSQALNDIYNYIRLVDHYILVKDNAEINIWFTGDVPTIIDNAATTMPSAQNSAVYTLDGSRVSNMQQHGIYVVNGKKLIK